MIQKPTKAEYNQRLKTIYQMLKTKPYKTSELGEIYSLNKITILRSYIDKMAPLLNSDEALVFDKRKWMIVKKDQVPEKRSYNKYADQPRNRIQKEFKKEFNGTAVRKDNLIDWYCSKNMFNHCNYSVNEIVRMVEKLNVKVV